MILEVVNMIEAVRRKLLTLGAPQRLGVAVSGGADSVFLLCALFELGYTAAVLHVNHKLRDKASDADEEFVRDLAVRRQVPFCALAAPVAAGNLEQEARRARYRFFSECRIKYGLDAIATGHTLDDQAETVLLRFLRGSGTQGLSGIRPVTPEGIIRPLLALRRSDIREWLQSSGIPWREDATNLSPDFDRNRARLETMPQLERDYNPSLARTLAATAEWALEEEAYWADEMARLAPGTLRVKPETVFFQNGPMLALPIAVQRRLLRQAVAAARGSLRGIDFAHIEAIRAMLSTEAGSGRLQLPGLEAYRSFDQFRLGPPGFDARLPRNFQLQLQLPGRTTLPDYALTIDTELVNGFDVYNKQRDLLDLDRCRVPLWLRNWRPGDSYCRQGEPGAQKIKQLFQEFRVPLWERRTWPVIVSGNPQDETSESLVVWTRRFGTAEQFAATEGSSRVLKIREMDVRETGESKKGAGTSKD
jgi:tRNA(Ile)-lysidine synthase